MVCSLQLLMDLLYYSIKYPFCLYTGLRNMSSNVHNLHLPTMVEDLGALWAHSCFPFESAIGELLKLFHGSQGIEK